MDARPLIEALPRDLVLTLVDVGSAGGLNPRWLPFAPIISSVLFDPREAGASGSFGRGQSKVYPVALGERAGEALLYLTRMANMSSFLRPDAEVFGRFGKKQGDAFVEAEEMVPIERLDELAAKDNFHPHILKVDTQGSELMVLGGAQQSLKSVVLAEIEASFFRRYHDQPLFADVQSHMAEQGFELIDLLKLKRYRASNRLGIRNVALPPGERSGRIAYADAIFLRREDDILGRNGEDILRAVVALTAYGKGDLAARLLDVGCEKIGRDRAQEVGAALSSIRPSGSRSLFTRLLGRSR